MKKRVKIDGAVIRCYQHLGQTSEVETRLNSLNDFIKPLDNFELLVSYFYFYADTLRIKDANDYLKKIRSYLKRTNNYSSPEAAILNIRENQLKAICNAEERLVDDNRQDFLDLFREYPLYINHTFSLLCQHAEILLMQGSHEMAINLLNIDESNEIPKWFIDSNHFIVYQCLKTITYIQCSRFF